MRLGFRRSGAVEDLKLHGVAVLDGLLGTSKVVNISFMIEMHTWPELPHMLDRIGS